MNKLLVPVLFLSLLAPLHALDVWLFPEAAGKNTLFLDTRFALVSTGGILISYPEYSFDFLLPLPLPFSFGAFVSTPDPNLKSFGLRAGYHISLTDDKTDLYILYRFDLGFVRKNTLERYNDSAPPPCYYDFRVGIRRVFGSFLCISLESAYKFRGIHAGISIRVH
jgi:hypothetical protein